MIKRCCNCHEEKLAIMFSKDSHQKDMLRRRCKDCDAKYARENRDAIKEAKRKSYLKNRSYNLEYSKEYRAKNREMVSDCDRKYRLENREKIAAQRARHRDENKEMYADRWARWAEANRDHLARYRLENNENISAKNKRYYTENKHRYYAWCRQRQAAKNDRTPEWLSEKHKREIEEIYREAIRLQGETGVEHHVDHIIPLQGDNVSGLHVPWNLQVITATENRKKGNSFKEWWF